MLRIIEIIDGRDEEARRIKIISRYRSTRKKKKKKKNKESGSVIRDARDEAVNEESGEKEKERERMGEKKAEAEKREQNRTEEGACNTRADRTRVKIVTSRRDDGPLDEQTPSTSTSTSNHFDPLSYLDSMLSKRKASPSNVHRAYHDDKSDGAIRVRNVRRDIPPFSTYPGIVTRRGSP